MEMLTFTVPAGPIGYFFPVRHAHAGEGISRAVLILSTQPTIATNTYWYLEQARNNLIVSAGNGALGTLFWPSGLTPGSYRPWEFDIPHTEGALVGMDEADVLLLHYVGNLGSPLIVWLGIG